jgi:hypothetical protein
MAKPVFLSYAKPYNNDQEKFIKDLVVFLQERGFEPRTLGVSDYDMDEPLTAIKRLMIQSYGIITVAFRRTYIERVIFNLKQVMKSMFQTSGLQVHTAKLNLQ